MTYFTYELCKRYEAIVDKEETQKVLEMLGDIKFYKDDTEVVEKANEIIVKDSVCEKHYFLDEKTRDERIEELKKDKSVKKIFYAVYNSAQSNEPSNES